MLSVGLGLYTGQRAPGPGRSYADAVPLAVVAERSGFDSFWVSEHHGWPDGYLPSPLTLLAAVAASTERITLGTAAVIAPLHHPIRLAEDAMVVDHVSDGRLVLGLALGYIGDEYEMFGAPRSGRAERLEHAIATLRRPPVVPGPRRDGGVSIWLGGYAAPALDRAARLADGHIVGRGEPHVVAAATERLAGTDRATFARAVIVACVLDDDGGHPATARNAFAVQQLAYERMQAGRRVYDGLVDDPAGSPALVAGSIDAYIQVAGRADQVVSGLVEVAAAIAGWEHRHVILRIVFPDEPPDEQHERIVTFGQRILPAFREAAAG